MSEIILIVSGVTILFGTIDMCGVADAPHPKTAIKRNLIKVGSGLAVGAFALVLKHFGF